MNNNLQMGGGRHRDSNLELYRIIVMLLIVAHHYVVNSGLMKVILESPISATSSAMLLFGAWGKTGINCFVLITGYFMCKSNFSAHKLLRLYLQITLYAVIIYVIFCITGHENWSMSSLLWKLFPIRSISYGFTSCFLIFFMLIPFINILVHNMNQRQHTALTLILLFVYTFLPNINKEVTYNYVSWFFVLYIVSSYIRLYGLGFELKPRIWGLISLGLIFIGSVSVIWIARYYLLAPYGMRNPYWFISDSNKLLALAIGVTSFMWFKGLRIPYSRTINAIGSTTFGVLLIHANSDAMRQWLWKEYIDTVGHFSNSMLPTLGYAVISVIIIFIICSGIDWFRMSFIEPHLLGWAEKALSKLNAEKIGYRMRKLLTV